MAGEKLHHFDLRLCGYVLDVVLGNLDRPEFVAFAEVHLSAPVLDLIKARDSDRSPLTMLLNEDEFLKLMQAIEGRLPEIDRPWEPYVELHRRSMDCFAEIRDALTKEFAEEWLRKSAEFGAQLESTRTRLSSGLDIVREWVGLLREYLHAMGATAFLPFPIGTFPTPTCPKPPAAPPSPEPRKTDNGSHEEMMSAIAETQALQREVRDLLLTQRTVKDFYSTVEVSEILAKAEFTVREWCRMGQCQADKKKTYRGGKKQWMIPHEELVRLQSDGPSSAGTYRLPSTEN